MKAACIHWFRFLIALLLMTLFFAYASCAKKPVATEVKTENNTFVDVEKQILKDRLQKSLAINDSFFKFIPKITTGATKVKDCDSLCNLKILEILKSINTKKQSGDNGYSLYYDELKKQLVLQVKQGETISQYKDSISEKNKIIASIKASKIEVPVKYVPTCIQYLAGFGVIVLIYLFVKFILFLKSKLPA